MTGNRPKAVELFAGVGGFHLGLKDSGWDTIWANQWEPGVRVQHAFDCYVRKFELEIDPRDPAKRVARGRGIVAINEDIAVVLEDRGRLLKEGLRKGGFDLLVGGFPCQDYSVAKSLNQSRGIEGKKGVLWWSIEEMIRRYEPRFIFLENVDRLLKSPADQRGRDFAIILACLADLNYRVEWRVINAADYGEPQRRRRVFIVAERGRGRFDADKAVRWITRDGILARAFPADLAEEDVIVPLPGTDSSDFVIPADLVDVSERFGLGRKVSPFLDAGVMHKRKVWTRRLTARSTEESKTLGEVLIPEEQVPEEFFIPDDRVEAWRRLKAAKKEERVADSGFRYWYSEGGIAFPDALDRPSRTILTGEGGTSPSRFKHVVETPSGRLRRLTPVELEALNGFPPRWTEGMPDTKRAFMMGNALVVPLIRRVGEVLADEVTKAKRSDARAAN